MMKLLFKRHKQAILWKERMVSLEDFAEIREYVDACLKPTNAPEELLNFLTTDFDDLLSLVKDLDTKIPWPTNEERMGALDVIPEPPRKPKPPPGSSKTKKDKARRKPALERYRDELKDWEKSVAIYRMRLPQFETCHQLFLDLKRRCEPYLMKKRIAQRLIHDLKIVITNGGFVHFEKLSWQLLPSGDSISTSVNRYLQASKARYPHRQYDSSRISHVVTLNPEKAYVGRDEFDGYVVFLFPNCDQAVLECPWVGNALYLLKGNWIELSRLPKSTLLCLHHHHAQRFIHDDHGNWFHQLKRTLKLTSPRT